VSPSPEDPPAPPGASPTAAGRQGSEAPEAGARAGSEAMAPEPTTPARRGPWMAAAGDALRILVPAALVAVTAVGLGAPVLHRFSHSVL
jgi:hypothetical protein